MRNHANSTSAETKQVLPESQQRKENSHRLWCHLCYCPVAWIPDRPTCNGAGWNRSFRYSAQLHWDRSRGPRHDWRLAGTLPESRRRARTVHPHDHPTDNAGVTVVPSRNRNHISASNMKVTFNLSFVWYYYCDRRDLNCRPLS
jgi:hypothetical protein